MAAHSYANIRGILDLLITGPEKHKRRSNRRVLKWAWKQRRQGAPLLFCRSAYGCAPACDSAIRFLVYSLPGTCPSARYRSPRDRARATIFRAWRRWCDRSERYSRLPDAF